MPVAVNIRRINTVPVIHLLIILTEMGRIVPNSSHDPEKIRRMGEKDLVNDTAVIKIFKNICSLPVCVIEGINVIQ